MNRLLSSVAVFALLAQSACAETAPASKAMVSTGKTIYASNTNTAMIGYGNDTTGDGSLAHPYLTVQKAQSQALPGDVVACAGVHQPTFTGSFADNASLSISGYGPCTLQAKPGNSRVISLQTAGAQLTLSGVTVDCAGAATGIVVYPGAYVTQITMAGVTFQGCTQYGVIGAGTGMHVSITSTGSTFNMDGRAAYRLSNWAEGGFLSTGDVLNPAAGNGTVYLAAAATAPGVTVSVVRPTWHITATRDDPHAIEAISLQNIANASISHATGEMHDPYGPCRHIHVSTDNVGSLDSSNLVVDSPVLLVDCKGGAGVVDGQDGPSYVPSNMANNPRIINPQITGTDFARQNALHAIEVGYVSVDPTLGPTVQGGTLSTTRYGIVFKGISGCAWADGVTVVGAKTNAFYKKGGDCAQFTNNIAAYLDGDPAAQVAFAEEDDGNGITWSNPHMILSGNVAAFAGPAAGYYVKVTTGAMGTAQGDNYWSASGAGTFSIKGAALDFPTWQQQYEPTATNVSPMTQLTKIMGAK